MKLACVALLLLILIPSCTIEKRVHNRGWNVQWRKHYRAKEDKATHQRERQLLEIDPQLSAQNVTVINKLEEEKRADMSFEEDYFKEDHHQLREVVAQKSLDTLRKSQKTVSSRSGEASSDRKQRRSNDKHTFGVILMIASIILIAGLFWYPLLFAGSVVTLVDLFVVILFTGALFILGLVALFISLILLNESKLSKSKKSLPTNE